MKLTTALLLASGLALSIVPTVALAQPGQARAVEAAAQPGDLLPIRRITLYRSGVGAFQREGLVEGNNLVQLKFDVAQINDILKSLQLLDLDGGRIDSVSYASRDPLARRLNSFSVPIADNPSMQVLLSRLRGAGVTLTAAEGTVTGTVLGVEVRKVPGGKDLPAIDSPFVSLVTPQGIRSININGITNFQLTDKALADELNKALAAVADSRADRVKTVDLSLSGSGARRVAVRYVHETPVWKTSYRLVLSDTPEAKKDPKPGADTLALQGWAIVENTTDTDWKDVRLSLVSGRPVSFQMDLAEPLYMGRPEIAVPTIPGVMPKSYEAGTTEGRKLAAKPASPPAPSSAGRGAVLADLAEPGFQMRRSAGEKRDFDAAAAPVMAGLPALELNADDLTRYSPQSQARAGGVGEIFFYEVSNPITVERQRSAMIPFLSTNITGRRVSIYNQNDRADHPMRGVELTNSSELQLLPGPLAVFDGVAYAGDATINQVSPGDKRLLAYAVDLDIAVTTKPEGSGEVTKIKIVSGSFEQTVKQVDALTYTFANKDLKRGRTIVLEHPKLSGWTLAAPAKATDETQALYRFEVTAEAGKNADFTVRQERIDMQRVGMDTYDVGAIVRFQQRGVLSPAVLKAFQELAQRRAAIADVERTVDELDRQTQTNTSEQSRISTTMQGLPREGELYADYTKELKELNTNLRTLRASRKSEGDKLEALQRGLNDFLGSLNVE